MTRALYVWNGWMSGRAQPAGRARAPDDIVIMSCQDAPNKLLRFVTDSPELTRQKSDCLSLKKISMKPLHQQKAGIADGIGGALRPNLLLNETLCGVVTRFPCSERCTRNLDYL